MPELPELEAIRKYLNKLLFKNKIIDIETFYHTVIRYPSANEFKELLQEARFLQIDRFGRMLRFSFKKPQIFLHLYIDHGLTGRLTFKHQEMKIPSKTVLSLKFDNNKSLIYYDSRLHGAIWLYSAQNGEEMDHPLVIDKYGPDIMQITEMEFVERLKKYRGEIKGILTNQKFVTGIGNAYSDDILHKAKIHPFSKRTDLNQEEIERLFQACQNVLSEAKSGIYEMISETGEFNEKKWRNNLLRVHLKGGEACFVCGHSISTIKSKKVTSFCRRCQPSKNKNFI
jgi:formamidopyrimidine-DNA glycosylase